MSPVTGVASPTKVCTKCGLEKPLAEFRIVNGRWCLNHCKPCMHKQMVDYHHRTWPERYKRDQQVRKERTRKFYHGTLKPRNLTLYGKATSPEETACHKLAREDNKKRTGYAKTESQRAQEREHFLILRTKVIALHGGKCECCGEAKYKMLTIDHKVKEYYKNKIRGVALVYDALREHAESGYPNDKYQLLCWNCNTSRGFYGYCPHTGRARGERDPQSDRRWLLKLEMIAAYGGECTLCGETAPEFLTIDHINGGGTKHREAVGVGATFYNYLRKLGWPTDAYRVLCANCNCSCKTNRRAEEVEA